MSGSHAEATVSALPDLSEALLAILPGYWRRVGATLDGERELEVILARRSEVDRAFLGDVADAQTSNSFDRDPLQAVELPPELAVAVDALSQRAARKWQASLDAPPSTAIFICRNFMRQLGDKLEVTKQMQLGLLKIFGRLVVDELPPALARMQSEAGLSTKLDEPERVLRVALTMVQNELVRALGGGYPAPPCHTLDDLLNSLADRVQQVTGRYVEVSQMAPDALGRLSKLFAPILDDEALDPNTQHMLATLMVPCFKLGIEDPSCLSAPGRPPHDLIEAVHEAATLTETGSPGHRKLLKTVQAVLEDFRDDDRSFVTTLVTLKAANARARRRAQFGKRQSLRIAESKVRLEQAQNTAQLAVTEKLAKRPVKLPQLLARVIDIDWINWLTLVLLRHGDKSPEWQQNLAFVDDLIWSGEPKTSISDVARLQSMLPNISELLHEGLQNVAYDEDLRRIFFGELRKTYQRLISKEYRSQLHIPAMSSKFRPRPLMTPVRLDSRDPKAVSELIRKLKAGTWFEFLNETGNFVRIKLSWVSPISDRFLFVDDNGLKLADKTQEELRVDLSRGSARALSRPV